MSTVSTPSMPVALLLIAGYRVLQISEAAYYRSRTRIRSRDRYGFDRAVRRSGRV